MELPDLWAQLKYWRRHPPVHLLVAAYLGFKAPTDADSDEAAFEEAQAVQRLNQSEFDDLLRRHGLPVGTNESPVQ